MIGIIGGLSPYSTILYYKHFVEGYLREKGVYPEIVIHSVPIQYVRGYVRSGDLDSLAGLLSDAARKLEEHGATHILIAANTPHIVADRVRSVLSGAEFHSILDAVWRKLEPLDVRRIGLLATGATVRYRLYHKYMEERGVEVVTPPPAMQRVLDEMIGNVVMGLIDTRARLRLSPILMSLLSKRVDAIVLGCTELPLIMGGTRIRVPIVDSVRAHVDFVLGKIL